MSAPRRGPALADPITEERLDHDVAAPAAPAADPERTTGLDALAQVQPNPSTPVHWVPHWEDDEQVVAEGPGHLGMLIAGLRGLDEPFGGVRLAGSAGPWSQVMHMGGAEFLVELHPHEHSDPSMPDMHFERVVPVTSVEAVRIAWEWVRRGEFPAEHDVELRVIPRGEQFDVEL